MNNAKKEIIVNLKKAIKDLIKEDVVPQLKHSVNEQHGDYSTNVALIIFSKLSPKGRLAFGQKAKNLEFKTPLELAQKIADQFMLNGPKSNTLERVEVVEPGFINFWLSNDYLINNLIQIDKQKNQYGNSENLENKQIMMEFADPNTLKEFHIGHLRNIIIGESVSRLLESQRAKVFRANYQGDVGLHVAKALWGIQQKFKVQPFGFAQDKSLKFKAIEELEKASFEEKVRFLAEAYTLGNKKYEEDEKVKEEIQTINHKIYRKDESIYELWEETRQWSLDYFNSIYERLNTHFDRLFFESEVYESGKKIVEEFVEKGIFTKDEGAVIFNGEKYGLHKRVFITRDGYATYEGKEMALGFLEYSVFPFNLNIHVVAHEQADYFKVVFKALELIDPKFKNIEEHLSYGMVELKEGKMSSRLGNIISGPWLLDEVKNRIKNNFKEIDNETLEKVAAGAVKYSMLKFSPVSNISFSFDESINLDGNSGPYLQYAYVRTQSIMRKQTGYQLPTTSLRLEPEELSLLRVLNHFSEVVEETVGDYAPNLLCNYLFNLAQKFNLFYQRHPILKAENKDFRLTLTAGVAQVLKNGLNLLAIDTPEKM